MREQNFESVCLRLPITVNIEKARDLKNSIE